MKKWMIFFLVTSCLIIIVKIVIPIMIINRADKIKTSFTDKQIKIIAEKLDVNYNELSIERMEYTNYRNYREKGKRVIQLRVFGKINTLTSIEKAYKLDKELSGKDEGSNYIEKEYSHKTYSNKFCIARRWDTSAPYDVYFRINEADQELAEMMSESS